MRPQLTSVVSSSGDQVKSVVTSIADGRISRAKNGWENYGEILSMSYATINSWLSRIDKDTVEERNAAVQNLWLQCWTQQEIADAVGMPLMSVNEVCTKIQNFEIPYIPGQFTEDQPEDSASAAKRKEWESVRQEKIVLLNRENAEHATEFETPIYNIWKQQEKSVACSAFAFSGLSSFGRLAFS